MKKHIITIAGKPGSGKSTTAQKVAEALNYERFSSGDLFRSLSQERGVELYQGNKLAEEDTSIDEQVDAKLQELGETKEEMVIDSRMAWHWIPQSFKVYLDLDLETAAERILSGMDAERRAIEHIPDSTQEYATQLEKRLESEAKRYLALYDQNPYDAAHYDLVVDTKVHNPDQVRELILEAYQKWITS
ncbi:nucleoside monophosphate kinase [Candidatus Kaiserbacteria bacterium]|nr:nucleoside monophosphate kinase [Candidatus Kaiserbacteria bacterium]